MGLQKYRADKPGERQKNGALPWYCEWMGGPSLAVIYKCPIKQLGVVGEQTLVKESNLPPRTVYVRGDADTFFSIPAVCQYRKKTIHGYITVDENREFFFVAYSDQSLDK